MGDEKFTILALVVSSNPASCARLALEARRALAGGNRCLLPISRELSESLRVYSTRFESVNDKAAEPNSTSKAEANDSAPTTAGSETRTKGTAKPCGHVDMCACEKWRKEPPKWIP